MLDEVWCLHPSKSINYNFVVVRFRLNSTTPHVLNGLNLLVGFTCKKESQCLLGIMSREQNTPVIPESDFETDLMEILSPVQTALPHATIEPRHTITLASPSPSPDFDEPHTIVFTSQPAEAPVVVALSAQTPRRATPFKHKVTHKKLFASHQ
ncbi:hypothetical protein F2Q68_00045205 [Brassica cretica]|uniref:Uncharacterized protein n=1 Tax=Brassica cretica TaxID=69181 RepID=A0A8S9LRP6_BRACR|nr:hypothetical protein F2Q68_00045205 [Brassica cretica]